MTPEEILKDVKKPSEEWFMKPGLVLVDPASIGLPSMQELLNTYNELYHDLSPYAPHILYPERLYDLMFSSVKELKHELETRKRLTQLQEPIE